MTLNEAIQQIPSLDVACLHRAQARLNRLTKPVASLGTSRGIGGQIRGHDR